MIEFAMCIKKNMSLFFRKTMLSIEEEAESASLFRKASKVIRYVDDDSNQLKFWNQSPAWGFESLRFWSLGILFEAAFNHQNFLYECLNIDLLPFLLFCDSFYIRDVASCVLAPIFSRAFDDVRRIIC